jgi:hypothetical protein
MRHHLSNVVVKAADADSAEVRAHIGENVKVGLVRLW